MMQEIKLLQDFSHVRILVLLLGLPLLTRLQDHITCYVSLFQDPGLVLVMELAACHLSKQMISSIADLETMSKQSLSALAYLHGQLITHRDVKPENILFGRHPPVWKLADFGLSSDALTMGTFCGTLEYLAPEVGTDKKYTPAVDIWALGAVIVEFDCGLPQRRLSRSLYSESVKTRAQQGTLGRYTKQMLCILPAERASAEKLLGDWNSQASDSFQERVTVLFGEVPRPRSPKPIILDEENCSIAKLNAEEWLTPLDKEECSTEKLTTKEWPTVLHEEEHPIPGLSRQPPV